MRSHFTGNVLDVVAESNGVMVAGVVCLFFAWPDAARVGERFEVVAGMLVRLRLKVVAMGAAMVSLNWSHREGQVRNGTLGADADRR